MPTSERAVTSDEDGLDLCLSEAERSLREGGIPIGAILVEEGRVVSRGHNRRVQDGDALGHAEIDCIRKAGRRATYDGTTLYTSGAPCFLCSGAIVQMGIPRVVTVGFDTAPGTKAFLESHGVVVTSLDHRGCIEILEAFTSTNRTLWMEDIGAKL